MNTDRIVRERTEQAARHLEEVFSTFVIVGLPLDTKHAPVIVSSGDEVVVRDLLTVAKKKKVG